LGNTIIVVEHDEDTIYSGDYLVDIGPGAGVHGGNVVVDGWLDKLLTAKKNDSGSVTLAYLRGEKAIEVPDERREKDKGWLKIKGGKAFNIQNLSAEVPLGRLGGITGVSGSGKSTFLYEILYENLRARFDKKYRTNKIYNAASFEGTEHLSPRDTDRPKRRLAARRAQPRHLYRRVYLYPRPVCRDNRGPRPRMEGVALFL
jgi:excinuclease ABC subunit A